jgi:hypothetical protein
VNSASNATRESAQAQILIYTLPQKRDTANVLFTSDRETGFKKKTAQQRGNGELL